MAFKKAAIFFGESVPSISFQKVFFPPGKDRWRSPLPFGLSWPLLTNRYYTFGTGNKSLSILFNSPRKVWCTFLILIQPSDMDGNMLFLFAQPLCARVSLVGLRTLSSTFEPKISSGGLVEDDL